MVGRDLVFGDGAGCAEQNISRQWNGKFIIFSLYLGFYELALYSLRTWIFPERSQSGCPVERAMPSFRNLT